MDYSASRRSTLAIAMKPQLPPVPGARRRAIGPVLSTLLAATLVACGGGGADGVSGSFEPAFGLAERQVVEGLAFPPTVPGLGAVTLPDIFPNLGGGGTAVAPDGNGRFFTADKNGVVWSFDITDRSTSIGTPFLDISAKVDSDGEAGLLGLAFDPSGGTNGPLYASYVAANPLRSVVSRFSRSAGNPLVADPASEVVLFERPRTQRIHCGGMVAFGPDGLLYASFGDDTQFNEAQNLAVHHGKILRMTRDGAPAPGNPFAGQAGDAPFVYALGFRNVWRFSFDRTTGVLWAGDVGESSVEEIDIVIAGRNYGWPHYEGTQELSNPQGLPFDMFEPPVHTYPHSAGKSVIGGYVYRGAQYPSLKGKYIFADFVAGRMLGLTWDAATQTVVSVDELATGINFPVTFAEDDSGELYISAGGQLLAIQASDPAGEPTIPNLLSETGIFADLATLATVPGLIPYDVVSPLWSDGAAKDRWIALPGLEQIQFDPVGNWIFPDGSVFVKHFEIELSNSTVARLETRVLWSDRGAWQGVTYRWNEAGTDADLLTGPETRALEVFDASQPGGVLSFDWQFPSPAQCLQCHTDSGGRVLGINTPQINSSYDYGSVIDNQLRAWNHIELFTSDIGPADNPDFATYVDPADPLAPLGDRARSYLAANCAHCHNEQTPSPVMDLRGSIPQDQMNVVDVDPNVDPFGVLDPKRIKRFNKDESVLWLRMQTLTPGIRMPPLSSQRVDSVGLEAVGGWADAGAPE